MVLDVIHRLLPLFYNVSKLENLRTSQYMSLCINCSHILKHIRPFSVSVLFFKVNKTLANVPALVGLENGQQ